MTYVVSAIGMIATVLLFYYVYILMKEDKK